jgi:hypothetical protein
MASQASGFGGVLPGPFAADPELGDEGLSNDIAVCLVSFVV